MSERFEMIQKIANDIKSRTDFKAEIAIVLGSGLGGLTDDVQIEKVIPYSEIAGFPVPTVEGHAGELVFGYLCGKNVIILKGRTHYYECLDMNRVTMTVRIIRMLGIEKLILTNAAGGIDPDFNRGDIMMIEDHISSFVPSPLLGKNIDEFGPRFPDMTNVYDSDVISRVTARVKEQGVDLKKGIYLQTTGPNYETPAEIKMYSALGANAVGMSTVCEAMVARHMGMKVCGLSCITNMAAGLEDGELSHDEVAEAALGAADHLKIVVKEAVSVI